MRKLIFTFLVICTQYLSVSAQTTFYDINTLQDIQIQFNTSNWDYIMDTAKAGSESFLPATVYINGLQIDSVGVKYKGNSSYDSTAIKNPLHIELNTYKNQTYQGFKDIKLSNAYGDPSLIREVLAYYMLGNYMHCPKANFAKVTINGQFIGIYTNTENIDKKFVADHFYSANRPFLKCNPSSSPGPATKSNFKYINADSASYKDLYDLKSDYGWADFIELCNTITNAPTQIENYYDVDKALWMLAFNNLLVNLDSYNGVFSQNHYVYKDTTNRFNSIIWDLNMCFAAFPFAGNGSTSMGTLNVTGCENLSPFNHATDLNWPLIKLINDNPSYKRRFMAHYRAIVLDFFSNNQYVNIAQQLQSVIATSAINDPNLSFGYTAFSHGLDSNYTFGSYTVPGIQRLMDNRINWLQSVSEYSAVPPAVLTYGWSAVNISVGNTVAFTAQVSNTNGGSVELHYRDNVYQKFQTLTLFDDGAHQDGAANDQIFGNQLTINSASVQYYIVAENSNAAIFLPSNAAYQYFTLQTMVTAATKDSLVINELLAQNDSWNKDEYNDREDWIELYNNAHKTIDLSSLYLSNNVSQLTKWRIPNGTLIAPGGYTTIWADDDSLELLLHTNFNLNKDSGVLILSNGIDIIDSVHFSQQKSDTTWARYPNGTGNFTYLIPTYGYQNNNWPLQVSHPTQTNQFLVYPNPAHQNIWVSSSEKQLSTNLQVYDMLGHLIVVKNFHAQTNLDTSSWPDGMYTFVLRNQSYKILIQHN